MRPYKVGGRRIAGSFGVLFFRGVDAGCRVFRDVVEQVIHTQAMFG